MDQKASWQAEDNPLLYILPSTVEARSEYTLHFKINIVYQLFPVMHAKAEALSNCVARREGYIRLFAKPCHHTLETSSKICNAMTQLQGTNVRAGLHADHH